MIKIRIRSLFIREDDYCMKKILVFMVALISFVSLSFAQLGTELMPNGSFKELDEKGWAVGWPKRGNALIKEDGQGRYLHIKGRENLGHKVSIKPDYGRLKLSMKMKVVGVELGKESWETGRLTMSFHDASGKMVGGWPDVFGFIGTTEWLDCEREYAVPKGAIELRFSACNLGKSGDVFFRDLSLKVSRVRAMAPSDLPVPEGYAGDPESLEDAFTLKTDKREKLCLNGLWRFRPVLEGEKLEGVPAKGNSWGWFKVPGVWPEGKWEISGGVQNVLFDPWLEENHELKNFEQGWYKRNLSVPAEWKERRIVLEFTMLQTHAQAFVDGKPAGSLWFPGGELDLTGHLIPGKSQELSLKVTARPISKDKLVFMAPDRAFKDKAYVKFKGITGDLYLSSMPKEKRLVDLQVITSVEKETIAFAAETSGLKQGEEYVLKAVVSENLTARQEPRPPLLRSDDTETDGRANLPVSRKQSHVKTFNSSPVKIDSAGKLTFESAWNDAKIWDTHTPQNLYSVVLQLCSKDGAVIDALTPVSFGFREYKINGRDFVLNKKPIHLRLLYNRSSISKADISNEATSRSMCKRMFEYGFNALIFGNYDFAPGSVAYMDGVLNACDKEGMLVCCSLPHVKDFGSKMEDPEVAERYRKLAHWIVRRVRNHPSVIMYAMNHNYCGYYGDQNPLKIDGKYELEFDEKDSKNKWRRQSRERSLVADKIAHELDTTRPVYHHQSGNHGDLHTVNIYLNWAPIQERSEWLRHWSTEGVKPLFFVEWGLPHISSWSSYRGPKFIWRTQAFQSLWAAEYAAQFWGDEAYRDDAAAVKGLDHEEKLWAKGEPFYWSQLNAPLRDMTENYLGVQALFANDNWRSHRAWGISAMLPWDQGGIWKEVEKGEIYTNPDALKNLKKPGVVPDSYGRNTRFIYAMDYLYKPDNESRFVPSPLGRSFLRWNMPDCAFIGGGEKNFAAKDHAYKPGESVCKNLIVLNDRREQQIVSWQWRLWLKGEVIKESSGCSKIPAGTQERVPVEFSVPAELKDGSRLNLTAVFNFEDGITQTDQFGIDIVEKAAVPELAKKIYLYDTEGLTAKLFDRLHVGYTKFSGSASELSELGYSKSSSNSKTVAGVRDPGSGSVLAIGRESLMKEGLSWINKLPETVDVIVFEQSSSVLEGLLGFRITERGMRSLFPRYPHAVIDPACSAGFRDWRGEATLIPPFLNGLPDYEEHNPIWQWCEHYCTRVWRSSNQGSAASVLIEKPQRGDWRVLLDCGFDLQYSPLLECVDNGRHIVFCQLDVTGRTEPDPVADRLVVNLLDYLDKTQSESVANVKVVGDKVIVLLDELNVINGSAGASPSQEMSTEERSEGGRGSRRAVGDKQIRVLVADSSAQPPADLHDQISKGLKVLCLGMDAKQIATWSPVPLKCVSTNTCFTRIEKLPAELNGLCNADWAWHGRMQYDAIVAGGEGNNALRILRHGKGCIIFCQVPPWKIDEKTKPYLRTSKRASHRLVARILANMGASFDTPLEERFTKPVEKAWLNSYYIDIPVAEDEPYRYYRW